MDGPKVNGFCASDLETVFIQLQIIKGLDLGNANISDTPAIFPLKPECSEKVIESPANPENKTQL